LGGQTPQTPPPDQQSPLPTFRAAVEAVQLSVIVTDGEGRPVKGLTQDDFEIFENRVPRPITTFAAVDIPIERRERELAEPDVLGNDRPPGRLYVIAFDEISPTSALRARVFLRQFVEKYFGPNDTAAVVLTTQGPRDSGQEFTSNPRLLLNAIDRFGGRLNDGSPGLGVSLREKNFIDDFRTLMAFMATLPGTRKTMIYVSEGFPVDAYDVVDARPARFGGLFSDVDPRSVEALSFATRNNIVIYTIDPRGSTGGFTDAGPAEPALFHAAEDGGARRPVEPGTDESFQAAIDALENRIVLGGLARVTGGFALTESNNYDDAFERLVRENSTYYTLAFNSGAPRDGRYVPIEVRVKRPGLQVRSMDGYIAPRGRPPRATQAAYGAGGRLGRRRERDHHERRVDACLCGAVQEQGRRQECHRGHHAGDRARQAQSRRAGRGVPRRARDPLRDHRRQEEEMADLEAPRSAGAQARDLRAGQPRRNPGAVAVVAAGGALSDPLVRGWRGPGRGRRL
jgi:VWFA-related protein